MITHITTPYTDNIWNYILNKTNCEKLHESLTSKSKINVLDIGCGVPYYAFYLPHLFDIAMVTGIDELSEKNAISNFISNVDKTKFDTTSINTLYDCYSMLMNERILLSKDIFDAIFTNNFLYNTYYQSLGKSHICKYDIIICSNWLHAYCGVDINQYLKEFSRLLNTDGVLIIVVEPEKEGFNFDEYKNAIEQTFEHGTFITNRASPVKSLFLSININK